MNEDQTPNDANNPAGTGVKTKNRLDNALENVEQSTRSDTNEAKELIYGLCDAVFSAPAVTDDSYGPQLLFRHDLTDAQKSTIASTLINVTSNGCEILPKEYEYRLIDLYDSVFGDTVYREKGVNARDQSYKKIAVLRESLAEFDDKLFALSDKLELENLTAYQQNVLKNIKSKKGSQFLGPFIGLSEFEDGFKKVVATTQAYIVADGFDAVEKYHAANTAIELLNNYCNARSNKYALRFFAPLVKSIAQRIDIDFHSSPLGKTTDVNLLACEKKYVGGASADLILKCYVEVVGPGMALDLTITPTEITSCDIRTPDIFLGNVEPSRLQIGFEVTSRANPASYIAEFTVDWKSGNNELHKKNFMIEFFTQTKQIDWNALRHAEPYSIDEVDSVDDFVGRSELLKSLESLVIGSRVGSAFIAGQKRVGKTSIAKTLQSILNDRGDPNYHVIYVEGGLYIKPTPQATIAALGQFLVSEIALAQREFGEIERPVFTDAFSPFVAYLRKVKRVSPDVKILIILDEFDELPIDLYRPNEISNSFFLSLRSVSNEKGFGFIMVGGEKMPYILNCQGHALNKFESFGVDYFDKQDQWRDFIDLVRRPTTNILEISDEAVAALYELVSGHPYYTKLMGRKIFRMMRERQDYHVTELEIQECYTNLIEDLKGNSFQHFWTDGIFEPEPRAEAVRTERRRFLIALAECIGVTASVSRDDINKALSRHGVGEEESRRILQTFLTRDVLVENNEYIRCKVPLFSDWLIRQGTTEIITTMSTLDAVLEYKKREQEASVKSSEISGLIRKWRAYAGSSITEDHVRTWLSQFGSHFRQRLMYNLVEKLRFYDENVIRKHMQTANGIVMRGKLQRFEQGKLKRSDIYVSYIDGPGKSGSRYAKLYADENGIYHDNVIEKGAILKHLASIERDVTLVFVDDIVGTGNSASNYIRQIAPTLRELGERGRVSIHFVAICGFTEGLKTLDSAIAKEKLSIKTNCLEQFGSHEKCFSEDSRFFSEEKDRVQAREIAYEIGLRLEKNAPLGYGQVECAIVFEDSCPNNTLPIIWSKQRDWIPLFRRM